MLSCVVTIRDNSSKTQVEHATGLPRGKFTIAAKRKLLEILNDAPGLHRGVSRLLLAHIQSDQREAPRDKPVASVQ